MCYNSKMGKLCDEVLMVGDAAISLSGHDSGRLYVVIAEIGSDFVLVADGQYRLVSNPKQKRRKHLSFVAKTNCELSDVSIKRQIKLLTEEQNAKRR